MGFGAMNEEVTLIKKATTQNAEGFPTETLTSQTVYAQVRSVGYAEFYAANSDANRAEIIFLIHPDEYDGQAELTYNSKTYRVIRPYTPPRGFTELHCVRK